jgi:uncharacterized protein
MARPHIEISPERIRDFCQRWEITELSLFGSVLREDFGPDSDVDVLVTFAAGTRWSLMDLVRMEEELQEILSRRVDLVERRAVEQSENYIRRRRILESLEPVYVA